MENILKQLYGDAVTKESLFLFKKELEKRYVQKSDLKQQKEDPKKQVEKKEKDQSTMIHLEEIQELRKEIYALKALYEEEKQKAEVREKELCLQNAVDRALVAEKARNLVAVKALLNMDAITLKEGTLQGLTEQLESLKQDNGYLFEGGENQPRFVRPSGRKSAFSQEDFEKMGYMERLKLKKEQPELYQKLTQNRGGRNLWQHI